MIAEKEIHQLNASILFSENSPTALESWPISPEFHMLATGPVSPSYREVVYYGATLNQLLHSIEQLYSEVHKLRSELARKPMFCTILLHDIGSGEIELAAPISVVLEETEEEAFARWPETRAYGIGHTASEAIHDLKINILDLFRDLIQRKRESLGEIAIETLRILEAHLRKRK